MLRYASYVWDAESALYYCSARYYDPATRQWTTGDPAKADGEESPYQYCGGEPVGEVDPTGLANHRSSVTVWNSSGARRMLGWFYYYDRGPTGGDSAAYVVAIDFVAAVKKPGNDTATKVRMRVRSMDFCKMVWVTKVDKTFTVKRGNMRECSDPSVWLFDTEIRLDVWGRTSRWQGLIENQDY